MADVTKGWFFDLGNPNGERFEGPGGNSSQIDEVSSSDASAAAAAEPAPGTTNGDSQSSDHGNAAAAVTSSTSVKPSARSFFPLRSSLLGSASSPSSSSPSKTNASTPATPSKGFVLNPPRLSNPFAKVDKDEELKSDEPRQSEVSSTPSKSEEAVVSSTPKSSVSFVPLGGEPSTPAVPPPPVSSTGAAPSFGFVFGQNIHEKVVEAATPVEGAASSTASENSNSATEETNEVTTNGTTSEMLFSAHVKKEAADKAEKAAQQDSGGKTLSEAAREYEEARAVKRKFEEVQVITGEEEESNVLQINCKLFSWSSSSWVERGRGTLRVNDFPANPTHHRLIVRSAGSLRVVLNTNIWSGMTVDRASNKSMRITAMDSNKVVKVFLIMASPKEMDQLQKCLEWRVNNLKKNEPTTKKTKDKEEENLPPALDDKLYTD